MKFLAKINYKLLFSFFNLRKSLKIPLEKEICFEIFNFVHTKIFYDCVKNDNICNSEKINVT